jgi:hypothetical protein
MPGFDPTLRLPFSAPERDPLAMRIVRTAIGAAILALIIVALAL